MTIAGLQAETQGERLARDIAAAVQDYAAGHTQQAIETMCAFWRLYEAMPEAVEQTVQYILSQRQPQLALESLRARLAENPHAALLRGRLAGIYLGQDRQAEALEHLDYLRRHEGAGDVMVHQLVLDTLHALGRLEEERDLAQAAQARFPSESRFYVAEGLARAGLADHAGSREAHSRGIDACDDVPHLHVSRGVLDFMLSDFERGFTDYAHRFDQKNALKLIFDTPRWQGEAPEGKKLLLYSEQGIGDIIMWATLLPYVQQQGAQITLAVLPKLLPLFARSFPELDLIPFEPETLLARQRDFDYVAPLGDLMQPVLPHYTPAEHPPLFRADAERSAALRERYLEIARGRGARRLVGISWHTTNQRTGPYRNIPLEQWKPILEQPQLQCICLQYGEHDDELEAIERALPGAIYRDAQISAFNDTDGLAAQVAAMDEVVTTQNATSHLGGALGVKTTLMLSAASSWRFGLKRLDNRWYRSLRLERQETIYDWEPVIARVAAALKKTA